MTEVCARSVYEYGQSRVITTIITTFIYVITAGFIDCMHSSLGDNKEEEEMLPCRR